MSIIVTMYDTDISCGQCGYSFRSQCMTDMVYGLLGLASEENRRVAVVNALSSPANEVFDEVEQIVVQLTGRQDDDSWLDRVQEAFGAGMDPMDGQSLHIDQGPSCPVCASSNVKEHYVIPVISSEVEWPEPTFFTWEVMDEKQKVQAVRDILSK